MKTLNISWLGACPQCDNENLKVETEKGIGSFLYEGDKITCAQCGNTGTVEVDDCAFACWDAPEEAKL
ncbi:hypothetical protein [Serratia fonticola]|uniref:hypothetical protein n=1 Tax=Serratia fonticola TaxID=47917 RepID=UPI003AAC65A6|nr:hypothetical protein [Serratia fonticola]HBE9093636.1 hypothetical protein [Serratia fonticola]HBE9152350.1 hypothetical protein [Serratia fonticola]